jgi:hormone-sensitive lipase
MDYRLAPKNKFPDALDDVWQQYNWIMDNAERILGIKPKKVILTGDSAGGNLAFALTVLLIKEKRRVPDSVFLVYPAVNLEDKYHSPSFLESIDDDFLSTSYVLSCRDAYIDGKNYHGNDPLASPYISPEYIYKEMPATRIVVGDADGLYDETIRLTQKLRKAKVDVETTVIRGMPHGYLAFDTPVGPSEATRGVYQTANVLIELLRL